MTSSSEVGRRRCAPDWERPTLSLSLSLGEDRVLRNRQPARYRELASRAVLASYLAIDQSPQLRCRLSRSRHRVRLAGQLFHTFWNGLYYSEAERGKWPE